MNEINPHCKASLWTILVIILIVGFIELTRQHKEVPAEVPAETCVTGEDK